MNKTWKSVAPVLVQRGLACAVAAGVSPRHFEKMTGISGTVTYEQDARIAGTQYVAMLNLIEKLPRPVNIIDPDDCDFSAPGFINTTAVVSNAPNLTTAFEKCINFRSLIGEVDNLLMRASGETFLFTFFLDGEARTPLMALNSFHGLILLAQQYCGKHAISASIELTGNERPGWCHLIDKVNCKVTFGQEISRLWLSASGANAPFHQHNKLLYKIFCEKAEIDLRFMRDVHSFHFKVEVYLRQLLHAQKEISESMMLLQTCQNFSLSRSAIHRRLQKEETNFHSIITKIRVDEAKRMLLQSQSNLVEIGDFLGFSSSSVFSRFFSEHVGVSPSTFKVWHESSK